MELELTRSEIADRTFKGYYDTCAGIVGFFGRNRLVDDLAADDFESFRALLAESLGPVTLGNEIGRVRMVFKYGYDQALIDKPIRYGQGFVTESSFACMAEILLNLRQMRVRMCEVPLVLRYDLKKGKSKMRVTRTVFRTLRLMVRSRLAS